MAERDLFSRLQRLFSTNVIVRNVGGRKLKTKTHDKFKNGIKVKI